MARRRYQKPTPKKRGKQWSILVREDVVEDGQRKRRVRRVPLGPAALTRAEAERLRDDYLATTNQASVGIGGAILFRDFARIYERDVLSTWASTTRARTKSVLKIHLNSTLGDLMLRELTLEALQHYFARLQSTKLSAESVDKVKDVLSAVLGTAVAYGRLSTNPAEKIRLKKRKLTKPKGCGSVNWRGYSGGIFTLIRLPLSSDTAGEIGMNRSRMPAGQRLRSTMMSLSEFKSSNRST